MLRGTDESRSLEDADDPRRTRLPNWCSNRLTVEGEPAAVAKWAADVSGDDADGQRVPLDFERVLPTPPEFVAGRTRSAQAVELLAAYDVADDHERQVLARAQPVLAEMMSEVVLGTSVDEVTQWSATDWRVYNWGVERVPAAETFRVDGEDARSGRIVIMFWSAWAPPRPLVVTLIRTCPELSFDLVYSEPDGGFAGRLRGASGEITADVETREPEEAVAILRDSGWPDEADDWVED